ncbi:MAG TPA: DUF6188 family protein [Gemmataceae bacterium]|nr:DUF6188 family protein [Gemmataceae bacterium]
MHGVPPGPDLSFLRGAELIQVCLGRHQVQFHFHPAGQISVEGMWELLDPAGARIDQSSDAPDRPPYQFHRLLGLAVVSVEVSAPDSFALRFDGGYVLRVFDDSEQYESFQVQPGGIVV